MKAVKIKQNNGTQTKHKVVKVVKFKRFMPRTDTSPVFKRKISFTNFNAKLPNIHTKHVELKNEILEDSLVKVEMKLNPNEMETSSNIEDNSGTCKVKVTENQKRKVKLRSCCHTPEELSKLTEHHDETLVKVGDMFDSREAFRKHLNDNAKKWFYYYVCRTSKKNVLVYNCICMAYSLKPMVVILRKRKLRSTACPCKIRLAFDDETKKFVVYYVCNHHDHELTETAFYNYPHAKYLPQEVKDVFLDLAYLGLDVDLIQKYIHSLVGLTIKRKDISSYAYKFKRKKIERNITAERRKYIKDLITTIRDTYKETMEFALQRISEEERQVNTGIKPNKPGQYNRKRRKSQRNSKEDHNTLPAIKYDDVNVDYTDPEDSILDKVLDSNELGSYDVIVQYINEEGILCDRNGTPVTNSSAIMQFINNYEYVPDSNVKDDFLEEGTVFSELVDNISADIYPLDWESLQETNVIEELDEVSEKMSPAVKIEDVDINVNIDEADTVECVLPSVQDTGVTILSNVLVNCDKRLSPTREGPAMYAEMEVFNKYYFVDHRYIKYEGENNIDQTRNAMKEKQRNRLDHIAKLAKADGKEYIKAPELDYIPTPLRQCSGHESLVLLADVDVVCPGAKFLTHEVFLKYINDRANRWYFYYSLVDCGKDPEYYVYKCVFGKHRSSKNAYRAKGLRKRSKLTTQCPCQIRLRRLYSEPAYLTVLYSCNHHDHALDAQLFKAQPHSRRLPEHMKEEIKDLLFLGAKFDVLRKYVTSKTGLRIYGKYFHNVRVKMLKAGETRELSEERIETLTQKLADLEWRFGSASKDNPKLDTSQLEPDLRRLSSTRIQTEDQCVQVDYDETASETQEYYDLAQMDDLAKEVCVIQSGTSQTQAASNQSRLVTRLKNLTSHEETLLNVKKLQESARSDNLRNTYEVVQYHSIP